MTLQLFDFEEVNMEFETKVIHVGQEPDVATGSVITPIYPSSIYTACKMEDGKCYMYSRLANPTRDALEECLASLENAKYCVTFASGVAAIAGVLCLLTPGSHVVCTRHLYGGTYKLFEEVYSNQDVTVTYVDADSVENFENAINEKTKIVWIESPTNPLLKIIDIKKVAEICKKHNILLCIDNTFASPCLQNPLDFGVDIVVHSMTKYINGHSDVIGGAVLTNDDELFDKIQHYQIVAGSVPSAFDSWLTLRGLKTLPLRMERHCSNAKKVAEYLSNHNKVEEVFYPGLESNPQYELARQQMKDFGGMVSFKIKGAQQEVNEFFKGLRLFKPTVSLGGVESLICAPGATPVASFPKDIKNELGITENLIRLSIGIEHIDDIIKDLENGFLNVNS